MQGSAQGNVHRAATPQLPSNSSAIQRDRLAFDRYRREREKTERRSVTRGLILMAIVVLVGSILRAGLDRAFVHGWWRP